MRLNSCHYVYLPRLDAGSFRPLRTRSGPPPSILRPKNRFQRYLQLSDGVGEGTGTLAAEGRVFCMMAD